MSHVELLNRIIEIENITPYISYYIKKKIRILFRYKDLIKGKTVLDMGAATGYISLLSKDLGAKKVIAIENNKELSMWIPREILSYDDLFKVKQSIDIIICFDVIEHLDNPERYLKRMDSLLKQKGYLFLSSPVPSFWWKILIFISNFIRFRKKLNLKEHSQFNPNMILKTLGYSIIEERTFGLGYPFHFWLLQKK